MQDEFHSLNKGVFVIPYQPRDTDTESTAGPSRPLKRVYDQAYQRYISSHEDFEKSRTDEQLDEIADWIERCAVPRLLRSALSTYRLPIAVIENITESLPGELPSLLGNVRTLQAREVGDLALAVKNIATAFIGDQVTETKKTGRTGMDDLEIWHKKQKSSPKLLLHIQDAHLVPSSTLAELLYILTLRQKIPFRILLSVSSASIFLSGLSHVKPSSIDLTVIQTGKSRKRAGGVNAILKGAKSGHELLSLDDGLAQEIAVTEELTGGGPAGALKALKWALLFHSVNSSLSALNSDQDLATLKAALREQTTVPGMESFRLRATADLANTLNPAPRVSVLNALSNPDSYKPSTTTPLTATTLDAGISNGGSMLDDTPRASKRKRIAHSPRIEAEEDEAEDVTAEDGDLKEIETLFNLWKSAGRSVNLWDWLQGFRSTLDEDKDGGSDKDVEQSEAGEGKPSDQEDIEAGANEKEAKGTETPDDGKAERDEAAQDRLHAAFIRFCEEARMLGLVRAKGKGTGRRADEVVKGVSLV